MGRKINVTITKENIYDVEKLINEIKNDPKGAFNLCRLHGNEGFTYDAFTDLDSLTEEAKDRLVIDFATSKSEAEASLSDQQVDQFDTYSGFFKVYA